MTEQIPPGEYTAKITNSKITTSTTGRKVVRTEYEITEGDFKGTKINDFKLSDGPFLRDWFWKLKYSYSINMTKLRDKLRRISMSEPVVRLKVKYCKEFILVQLLRRLKK